MKNISIVDENEVDEFYLLVSKNVQRIRKEKKKPQLDLVLEIGLKSISYYSKCERCVEKHHFNLKNLYAIAKALEVDICEFFIKKEEGKKVG